jgi:membrane protein DedA with SNARE-associated domain
VTFSLIGTLVALIITVLATIGLVGLFALMAVESFGIPPIPSEAILPFAGFLIAEGVFPLGWTIVAALAGGLVGSFAAYAVGRWWRPRLLGLGVGYIRVRAEDLERMDRWFARRGEVTVALARVIPAVRSYISYPAGTARMDPARFGLYTLIGSTPWTLALLYAGIVLGSHWQQATAYFEPVDIVLVIVIIAAAIYVVLIATGTVTASWPPRRGPRLTGIPSDTPRKPPATPPTP